MFSILEKGFDYDYFATDVFDKIEFLLSFDVRPCLNKYSRLLDLCPNRVYRVLKLRNREIFVKFLSLFRETISHLILKHFNTKRQTAEHVGV